MRTLSILTAMLFLAGCGAFQERAEVVVEPVCLDDAPDLEDARVVVWCDDGGSGGSLDSGGSSNHSGLGDGTNPGEADNTANAGTDNPGGGGGGGGASSSSGDSSGGGGGNGGGNGNGGGKK